MSQQMSQKTPTTVCKPPYPSKFHVGDIVVSKYDIQFTNGFKHSQGEKIKVTEFTVSYFNVCHENYELVKPIV